MSTRNPKMQVSTWINGIKKLNKKPLIEVIDEVPNRESGYWEQFYINMMKTWGFSLLNTTNAFTVRTYRNHTNLAAINRLGITFKQFCEVCFLDYKTLYNTITIEGNFTYSQSMIIQNNIEYVKNHPTICQFKRHKRTKRKKQKKVANSRMSHICAA